MSLPLTVAPGATATITVGFTPTTAGVRSGTLTVTSNAAGGDATAALTGTGTGGGTAPTLLRLSTSGNQIVDSAGTTVRLKSVNWFGGEGTNFTPNGIWSRGYKDMLDQIKAFGFNCIRLPFADDILTQAPASINYFTNADLVGLSAMEVLDAIINYGGSIGLYFVLDHHRWSATSGSGTDGWPPASGTGGYTASQWLATWSAMATRYHANPAVCGCDLHNEPYQPTWATWATMVETLANQIHTIAPDWLVFVEGVGGSGFWWGGNLSGVATRPVALTVPNKVIYSPHEYGQSITAQTWLQTTTNTVIGWPNSLRAIWQASWGFIFTSNIAPLYIGEFGGKFGFTGGGAADAAQVNAAYEVQWVQTLARYLNGDTDLDGTTNLASPTLL